MECVLIVPREHWLKRRAAERLLDEAKELMGAVHSAARPAVLDELADVLFFIRELSALHGITQEQLTTYSERKGTLREFHGKDKVAELGMAALLLNEWDPSVATVHHLPTKDYNGQEGSS